MVDIVPQLRRYNNQVIVVLEKRISVIVPIYNTKDYLRKCLDSIAHQTYKNLEIICVDDGSDDGSEEIVDEIAAGDSRFIVIHQENGGESRARNVGLRLTTGEYVAFVDCDDWLEADMYSTLVSLMEKNTLDIAACGYTKDENNISTEAINIGNVKKGIISQEEMLRYVYQRDKYRAVTGYIWCKLFKKEVLRDDNGEWILFDEGLALGGDILFFAEAALRSYRFMYIPKSFYHYIQHKASGSHSKDEYKCLDAIRTYEMLIKRLEAARISDDILIWVKRFLVYRSELVAELAFGKNNSEILSYSKSVMKQYEIEYRETNLEYPDRIALFEKIMSYQV